MQNFLGQAKKDYILVLPRNQDWVKRQYSSLKIQNVVTEFQKAPSWYRIGGLMQNNISRNTTKISDETSAWPPASPLVLPPQQELEVYLTWLTLGMS